MEFVYGSEVCCMFYHMTMLDHFCALMRQRSLPHAFSVAFQRLRFLLPFIPYNASFITGSGATRLMGPWIGPAAGMGGWMMELMGVLISGKTALLLDCQGI